MSPGFLLGVPPRAGVTGLQLLDVATYLPGDLLPKSDIASMAHSLELRSPLLDHRVLELGLSLPARLKRGKLALRRAFADDLPPLVAERGKAGFGVPLAAWFRGELRELAHDVLLNDRGRFERSATARAKRRSSYRSSAKPTVNVRTGSADACAIWATTIAESMPPESSAPRGTSATSRRRTARETSSRTRSSHADSASGSSTTVGCQ